MKKYFMYFFGILIPAIILIFGGLLTYNYAYDEPEKSLIEDYVENNVGAEEIYDSKLERIKLYSVGDVIAEQELIGLEYSTSRYSIWFDVHEKKENRCFYELKGLHIDNNDKATIDWRFYIKTKNDIIISIVRG